VPLSLLRRLRPCCAKLRKHEFRVYSWSALVTLLDQAAQALDLGGRNPALSASIAQRIADHFFGIRVVTGRDRIASTMRDESSTLIT
jgi:hypothetical protein